MDVVYIIYFRLYFLKSKLDIRRGGMGEREEGREKNFFGNFSKKA